MFSTVALLACDKAMATWGFQDNKHPENRQLFHMGYYFVYYSARLRTSLRFGDKYPKNTKENGKNYGKYPPGGSNVVKTEIP